MLDLVPLLSIKTNSRIIIQTMLLEKQLRKKLGELGILANREYSVVAKPNNRVIVLATRHFQIALDAVIAKSLMVKAI